MVEIERKFLIDDPPADIHRYPYAEIEQGYLIITDNGTELRIRKRDARYVLTLKRGTGLTRSEVEIELNREQYRSLRPNILGSAIRKTRFVMPWESYTVELDVYGDGLRGLVTAEVEFSSVEESHRFSPPGWFAEEITEDARYKNQSLALYGLPDIEKRY